MESIKRETYWNDIVSAFPILSDDDESPKECNDQQFIFIRKMITENKKTNIVSGMVMNNVINEISVIMSKRFWLYFMRDESIEISRLQNINELIPEDFTGFEEFKNAVCDIYKIVASYENTINRLQMLYGNNRINLLNNFYARIWALLYSHLPFDYNIIIYHFYRTSLRCFTKDKEKVLDSTCTGCFFEITNCHCNYIVDIFNLINSQLNTIGILESLAGDVILNLMCTIVETEVKKKTTYNYVEHQSSALEKWIDTVVYDWLKHIFKPKRNIMVTLIDKPILEEYIIKLKHTFYKSYTKSRFDQLYEIIIRYPYSKPVVDDLTDTLQKTNLNPELYQTLQDVLQSKLLKSNINSIDILCAYIATINILRQIDPSESLLQHVTRLLKKYLRSRMDTVNILIFILTRETHYNGLFNNIDYFGGYSIPLNILDNLSNNFNKCDIVALLVDIFGSQKMFVNHYKTSLAGRLLEPYCNKKFSQEMKYLDLLESRFSGSLLNSCEIMLNDIFNSKQTNDYILYSKLNSSLTYVHNNTFSVNAIIISEQYWPKFKETFNVKLPPIIQKHLDYYKKCFEIYKSNRTLIWKPNLGKIKIDMILEDKVINVTVSPIHATIIWHFQNKVEWDIKNLSIKTNVPYKKLQKYLKFWIHKGVLRRKHFDKIILVNNLPSQEAFNEIDLSHVSQYNDTIESIVVSAEEQRNKELQNFWSYLKNILRSRNGMPLVNIQKMWKAFNSQATFENSVAENDNDEIDLSILLDAKICKKSLIFSNGLYTLIE